MEAIMFRERKLTIELVPATTWWSNLRKLLPKSEWDKLRKKVYADYSYKCGICGTKGRLNCHEIWEYDDQNHVQRLAGFIALCDLCHHVKHIGLAGIRASEGKLDFETVIQHYLKVNDCSRETFDKDMAEAFSQWEERSKYEWHVDLGEYESLVQRGSSQQLQLF